VHPQFQSPCFRQPDVAPAHLLRDLAGGEVGTKPDGAAAPSSANLQDQRAPGNNARSPPASMRCSAMRSRATAGKEIDRGTTASVVRVESGFVAKVSRLVLALPDALQFEPRDDVGGGGNPPIGFFFAFAPIRRKIRALCRIRHASRDGGSSAVQETRWFLLFAKQRRTAGLLAAPLESRTSRQRAFRRGVLGSMVSGRI